MRRPSSARCWWGQRLRLESLEGWSCCLRSLAQSCSALQHNHKDTHLSALTRKKTTSVRLNHIVSCTDVFQIVSDVKISGEPVDFCLPPSDTAWLCKKKQNEVKRFYDHTKPRKASNIQFFGQCCSN